MKTITKADALDALKQAVEERGESFIYADHYNRPGSCQYVEVVGEGRSEVACIAGNALHRLGVPLDVLTKLDRDGYNSMTVNDYYALETLAKHGFALTYDAAIALRTAQFEQDRDVSWGGALQRAMAKASR